MNLFDDDKFCPFCLDTINGNNSNTVSSGRSKWCRILCSLQLRGVKGSFCASCILMLHTVYMYRLSCPLSQLSCHNSAHSHCSTSLSIEVDMSDRNFDFCHEGRARQKHIIHFSSRVTLEHFTQIHHSSGNKFHLSDHKVRGEKSCNAGTLGAEWPAYHFTFVKSVKPAFKNQELGWSLQHVNRTQKSNRYSYKP